MSEKKTIRKWFWAWDFEKEERWLNEMALSGWKLCEVGFAVYHFEPCEPGEYIIRLEMHDHDEAYLSFMQEIGAEYIGRLFKWVYFCRKSELGAFDIFSDIDSRLAHLKKISTLLSAVGGANLAIGLANSVNPVVNMGWINLLCATLLMYGLGRIHGKMEHLKRERELRE